MEDDNSLSDRDEWSSLDREDPEQDSVFDGEDFFNENRPTLTKALTEPLLPITFIRSI